MYIREICGTFSSSDFTDESEVILAYRITHGFSQIFGLCPMACARYVLLLSFCHADFADNADFSSWCFFVPQISQINTDLYEIKNLRHLRNLRDQNLPQKICVHPCKSVGHIPLSGGICIDRIGRFRVNP